MKKSCVRLVFFAWCIISLVCVSNVLPQKEVSQNKSTKNQVENVTPAATLLVEDFTYASGSLLTANGWTAHSGAGTNAVATSSPGLTLAGYPSSGIGNAVSLTTSGEDVNRTFAVQSTGSVYAAFMVTVSEATLDPLGGYFFHLGPDPVGTTFRGRVFVAKDASNNVAFGISKALTTAGNITFTPFSFSLNTTYLIVVKYTIVDGATNDTVSMIVSTTVPASEPAPTVTATDITQTDINPGTVSLRQGAVATAPTARVDGIRIGNTWADVTTSTPTVTQNVVDFNGDGKTDFAVTRTAGSQLTWFINLNGTATSYGSDWGISGDISVPVDYDGDNKTDIAVWRPISTGQPSGNAFFYILNSATNTVTVSDFGQMGDDATVVGDYDGDGKADVAVYRGGPTTGTQSIWYYRGTLNNPSGNITFVPWGSNGDRVAPGDYDGDGKHDFVIRRGQAPTIFWRNQTTAGQDVVEFGLATDNNVPGDYDGDGKTDIAIVRISGGAFHWWHRKSSDGSVVQTIFGGIPGDFVVQGDYDGDGKTDQAVWRSGVFWVNGSTSGVGAVAYGGSGDSPVATYNIH